MTMPASQPPHRVLIAGGGIAAIEALLALEELAGPRARITLLSPNRVFSPPAASVLESFGAAPSGRLDLASLALSCGAVFVEDSLASVDTNGHVATTALGASLRYDSLLIATGGQKKATLRWSTPFGLPGSSAGLRRIVEHARIGLLSRIAFVLTPANTWTMPLYELALLTAAEAAPGVRVTVVTPEAKPLAIFGPEATRSIQALLDDAGIELIASAIGDQRRNSALELWPDRGVLAADAFVSLATVEGPRLSGLPSDGHGFLAVDAHGAVLGVRDVWAAGDATAFRIKQGGLACQQADAAAESIAAIAGAPIEPRPFEPVLRGLLRTHTTPLWMRADVNGGTPHAQAASDSALWWPPAKVAGRRLGPLLGSDTLTPGSGIEVSAPVPGLVTGPGGPLGPSAIELLAAS